MQPITSLKASSEPIQLIHLKNIYRITPTIPAQYPQGHVILQQACTICLSTANTLLPQVLLLLFLLFSSSSAIAQQPGLLYIACPHLSIHCSSFLNFLYLVYQNHVPYSTTQTVFILTCYSQACVQVSRHMTFYREMSAPCLTFNLEDQVSVFMTPEKRWPHYTPPRIW